MLLRVLRFFGAPRTWRVIVLVVLGVLLSAGAFAFQLPPRTSLSGQWHPAEMVGVYEIVAPRPGVYLQLAADGSARVEFVDLEDTGTGLRAKTGEKRKEGWWWVERPDDGNPLSALYSRPRFCEQFRAAHPPQCRAFERDAGSGDLVVGQFGPFVRRITGRYNKRIVRPASELRVVPPAVSPLELPTQADTTSDSTRAAAGGAP